MTFENCYIVLSWADGTCNRYSDEFTCDEDELLVNVRRFIQKNKKSPVKMAFLQAVKTIITGP